MVNDPGYQQGCGFKYGVNKEKADIERERLFKIIEDLVLWENTNNETVLAAARAEILRSWRETCELNKNHPQAAELFNPDKLPAFHDPFAGGGALPLEAQRLGLESYASDLNPVAVTINKAMIEIPPKFAGLPPVGPELETQGKRSADMFANSWQGARGLAEDVRRYGAWMRAEAEKRIGRFYPKIEVTADMVAERPDLAPLLGQKLTVIAWLWARTVKSPNPAFSHVDVPLASTFVLSSKAGKEAYVQPVVEGDRYHFMVKVGKPPESAKGGTTAGKRAGFFCLLSASPMDYKYIRNEGSAGRMGAKLMAIVAEGAHGRVYLSPTEEQELCAHQVKPEWKPETPLHGKCRVNVSNYGLDVYGDLFTPRQLVALTTFADLVPEAIARVREDAAQAFAALAESRMQAAGIRPEDAAHYPEIAALLDPNPLDQGGTGAAAYAEAVGVYLAFAINKMCDRGSSICGWDTSRDSIRNTFGRQAIPMVWDFAEANFIEQSAGSYENAIDQGQRVVREYLPARAAGFAVQADAQSQSISKNKVISTDPPYYDNIGYADLSDFFTSGCARA
jgi:Adenine-specific DNA methylase containing a Zn-ribbon